jgi:3-oxoacyl-[acyl-carrier protein] reductase
MILADQVALITGAGRGIGKGIAVRMAEAGASIVVVDINEQTASDTATEIEKNCSVKTASFGCDVSDYEQVSSVLDQVIERFGRLDILVNNAGITRDTLIMRMKPEDWDIVLKVNLTGAFNFLRAASLQMVRKRSGAIINISSVVGLTGNPGQANYAASKAGLIGLTKTAAKEFASRNIRVNAVAPGFIETEMTTHLSDSVKEQWHEIIPLKRSGTIDDVASAVVFLAGPDSKYITGQVLPVDGGMVM